MDNENQRRYNNLNASIAATLNIKDIRRNEEVVITITNHTEDWQGNYVFTVFNSKQKNSKQEITGAISIIGNELLLTIAPEAQ